MPESRSKVGLRRAKNPYFLTYFGPTVGTKIIADPEKCFQELISEKLQILLRDRPCLEIIIVSSNFQASFFLQDKLLESVSQVLIPVKKSRKLLDVPFPEIIQ